MKYGIDYIGGANYKKVIVRHHPKGYAAGFLCHASGWKSGLVAARALAKTGKAPVIRIHALWRDSHHFTQKDIKPAVNWAEKVAKLAEQYPDIKFYFSPWLEHRANGALFKKCRKACRKVLPRKVKFVCSGPPIKKCINEMHHSWQTPPGKYIFSYDGADMTQENVDADKRRHLRAIQFYGWVPRCNGKRHENDSTPRPLRKAWLRKKDILEMVRLLND